MKHQVVSPEAWLIARKGLLAKEKDFNRLRDHLSEERRKLPWVRVEKAYDFDGPDGKESLSDLFAGRSQLVVYHFMFDTDWEEGCKSCSFWADNFNGIVVHLGQRDVSMVAVSRAPLAKIEPFRKRMGWTFKWVSSFATDFNRDCGVSFTPEEVAQGKRSYNYGTQAYPATEAHGASVFRKEPDGAVFHTYSTYGRGLDMLNTAYHYLDLVPKGRDEADLPYTMAWVRHRDRYD